MKNNNQKLTTTEKPRYETPKMEVILFDENDIVNTIQASGAGFYGEEDMFDENGIFVG